MKKWQPLLGTTSAAARASPVAAQFEGLERFLLCDIGTDFLNITDLQCSHILETYRLCCHLSLPVPGLPCRTMHEMLSRPRCHQDRGLHILTFPWHSQRYLRLPTKDLARDGHEPCKTAHMLAAERGLPAHLPGLVALVIFLKHSPLQLHLNTENMCTWSCVQVPFYGESFPQKSCQSAASLASEMEGFSAWKHMAASPFS